MEYVINGMQGRRELLDMMRQASAPLSGGALGKEASVSHQVVVQDIALLHTVGYPIPSTARGYILNEFKHAFRLFKVCHTNRQTEDELVTVVDLSGAVASVMVDHRVYGKMSAPLSIKNRHSIQLFTNSIQTGKSTLLMNITSGHHFHHVCAEQEEMLDEIEEALKKEHYLADLLLYEMSDDG